MGKHQCTACKRTFRTAQGLGLHFNHARKNPKVCDGQPRIDPRDAEIARLKARAEKAETEARERYASLVAVSQQLVEARTILSCLDLGAGKVLVEREVVERVRDADLSAIAALMTLGHYDGVVINQLRAAIADLDALLKQGGE